MFPQNNNIDVDDWSDDINAGQRFVKGLIFAVILNAALLIVAGYVAYKIMP